MQVPMNKNGGRSLPPLLPKGVYKCPKCDSEIEVFVRMSLPPACLNHTGGPTTMEKSKK
jgi:hypothetical protein